MITEWHILKTRMVKSFLWLLFITGLMWFSLTVHILQTWLLSTLREIRQESDLKEVESKSIEWGGKGSASWSRNSLGENPMTWMGRSVGAGLRMSSEPQWLKMPGSSGTAPPWCPQWSKNVLSTQSCSGHWVTSKTQRPTRNRHWLEEIRLGPWKEGQSQLCMEHKA
jgi:hypothetical protein